MWIEEQESNDEEALERAWSALQHTPSYVERFRTGLSSLEAEAHGPAWTFCLGCGFWVEEAHACPQRQEVSA
jgi:hypothetical protein